MTPENPSTALVTTSQFPALARVSNQLALTNKLLSKYTIMQNEINDSIGLLALSTERLLHAIHSNGEFESRWLKTNKWPTVREYGESLSQYEENEIKAKIDMYTDQMKMHNLYYLFYHYRRRLDQSPNLHLRWKEIQDRFPDYLDRIDEALLNHRTNLEKMRNKLMSNPITNELIVKYNCYNLQTN
ncbi:hypothetical protein [Fibrella aquatilis]|uniref:Uncharacterized protein n=1 Tax=Fibrella aquatilis TaxID=2817059 RepID=A0A939G9I4_9BACT|nr:hypothetical protein [Fibrella aquatilis]MBO0934744.1 hypothetical protein [Fibrella aquatilis]